MATCLILGTKKPRMACCTIIMVRPFSYPVPSSCSPSPTQEVQPEFSRFCQTDQQPEDQVSGQKAKEPDSPPASVAPRITTPSPAPHCGHGDSPYTQSTATSSNSSGSSRIPKGSSQSQQGLARRFLDFILRKIYLRLLKKQCGKQNKVEVL